MPTSKRTFFFGIFLFLILINALFATLLLVNKNQDIRQQAYLETTTSQLECVKAGCYNERCVSREVDRTIISSVCDFQPQYACYQDVECTVQTSGECGFTPSAELEQCLTHPPQQYPESCDLDAQHRPICDFYSPPPGSCPAGQHPTGNLDECGCFVNLTCVNNTDQPPSADLNNDSIVDIDDYSILKQELMKSLTSYRADLTNDGWVDLDDYTILKSQLSLF